MDSSEAYGIINQAANEARAAVEAWLRSAEDQQQQEHGGTSGLLYIGTMIGCSLAMADAAAMLQLDHDADEEEVGQWVATALSSFDEWRRQRVADPDGPIPIFEAEPGKSELS